MNQQGQQRVAKVTMSVDAVNNLYTFLDRVEIKGLKEISAMNEILAGVRQAKVETVQPQPQPQPQPTPRPQPKPPVEKLDRKGPEGEPESK